MKIKKGEVYIWIIYNGEEQYYKVINVKEKNLTIRRIATPRKYNKIEGGLLVNLETFKEAIKNGKIIKMSKLKSRLLYDQK